MADDWSTPNVRPLLPAGTPQPLEGLYRDAELPTSGRFGPWVYANFVATLDGRIAMTDPATGRFGVTEAIGDPRDWRLFQELAARADVVLTSGRYLRDLRLGTAQDVLPLSSRSAFQDLRQWREAQGLATHPDVAVLSTSLAFELPDALFRQGRSVTVLTTSGADPVARARHEAAGARVVAVNDGDAVDGVAPAPHQGESGYQRANSVTGPYVLHALLQAGALDSLFITQRHRIVAGGGYSTIAEGAPLAPPVDLRLEWLYLDEAPGSAQQQFARFIPEYPRA